MKENKIDVAQKQASLFGLSKLRLKKAKISICPHSKQRSIITSLGAFS